MNGTIIWPDTGEEAILIERQKEEKQELENAFSEENNLVTYSGDELITLDMTNPLAIKELLEQKESTYKEVAYIEKDMIHGVTESLRKFYEEQQKDEEI